MPVARLLLAFAALVLALPHGAGAHEKIGANLNFIGDFRRNHEFVDVVRQSRRLLKLGTFDDQVSANLAPLGPDGWSTTDFRILAMAAQQDTANLSGTYRIAFTGSANLATGGEGTIANKVFDAGTNTTHADLLFPAGAQNLVVDFTATGGLVKDVRIVRPGYDADSPPLLHGPWASHAGRFPVLRFLDWTRTNGNRDISWADRTTPEKLKTEAYIAKWETVIAAANTLGRDAWINVPVQADDGYVTNLATLFRDQLAPGLNLYVEYGNELWNFNLRDSDMDTINGGSFNGATVNRDLAAASAAGSPLRYDGESNATTLGFRRVALRLKQISDIFKSVWGPAAINTRVRPVLAGQMANSFIVSEGLRLVDEGLDVRPETVFYAISGAPYIFASAIPDGNADEVPDFTKQQVLDGLAAGVANAPQENAYQYLTHAGLGAWYGLKVVAYEAGFDNFGGANIDAKRQANLDPAIRAICRDFVNQWHGFGFEHILWFNAGADSYQTPFGMWPLVEDMGNQAVPKNQCVDDILAAPLPPITVGTPVAGAPVPGGNYRGGGSPSGPLSGLEGPFGFPGYVEYLLRTEVEGAYTLVFTGSAPPGETFRLKLNNATVAANVALPSSSGASASLTVTLRKGLNAMRIERSVGASWSVASFAFTRAAQAVSDFNGDGKPDLLWSNTASGATYAWYMNGPVLISDAFVATIDPSWKVQGVADFNGDGKPDIVWRNTANGNTYVWYMNGSTLVSDAFLFSLPPEWVIQGVADFNGDGKPDFLMRNSVSGNAFAWFFNNATAIGDQFLFGIDPSWKVEGVGDLNGDGQPDLFFRNNVSGLAFAWFTQYSASTLSLGGSTPTLFSIDPAWEIVQVADWNGDGSPDFIFRNRDTGLVFVWYVNGTVLAGSDFIVAIDPSWEIVPRR